MFRMSPLAAIAAVTAISAVAPASAQTRSYYSATFAAAPANAKFVTRNTVWNCAGTTCTAPKSTSRDQIMCELVVRETGVLTGFSVNGNAFDADALTRCNARAK